MPLIPLYAASSDGAAPTFTRVQRNAAVVVGGTTKAVTLGSAPTVGNVLRADVSVDKNSGTFSLPGWNKVNEAINTSTSSCQFWRQVDGTEGTTVTVSHVTAQDGKIEVEEWSGSAGGAWSLIASGVTNSDQTNVGAQSVTSSALSATHGIAFALASKDTVQGAETGSWSAGWTMDYAGPSDTLPGLWSGSQAVSGQGSTVSATLTIGGTVTTDQMNASVMVLAQAGGGGGPVTPTLSRRVVGPTRLLTVNTSNAGSVRIKVGTDAALTAEVQWGAAATPDAQGNSDHDLSSLTLTPGATYYYRVAMTPTGGTEVLDTAATVGRFKVPPVGKTSFSFSFSSCEDTASPVTYDTLAALSDDLYLQMGDFWYADGSGNTLANYRDKMGTKLAETRHQSVFSQRACVFIPSDHDGGMNDSINGSMDPTALANYNAVHREMIPAPLPANGVYFTFTWGRVRFLALDCRTFASATGEADSAIPGRTVLGTTQKQWLKDTITNDTTSGVFVLLSAQMWTGPATDYEDDWTGYDRERQELAAFFVASGKSIVLLHGDVHALAANDGSASSPGGIAVFDGSPTDRTSSQGGVYTVGPYPASGTTRVQQYGRITVTDNGENIVLAYEGRSADNTVRVALTKTYNVLRVHTGAGDRVNAQVRGVHNGDGTFAAGTVSVP